MSTLNGLNKDVANQLVDWLQTPYAQELSEKAAEVMESLIKNKRFAGYESGKPNLVWSRDPSKASLPPKRGPAFLINLNDLKSPTEASLGTLEKIFSFVPEIIKDLPSNNVESGVGIKKKGKKRRCTLCNMANHISSNTKYHPKGGDLNQLARNAVARYNSEKKKADDYIKTLDTHKSGGDANESVLNQMERGRSRKKRESKVASVMDSRAKSGIAFMNSPQYRNLDPSRKKLIDYWISRGSLEWSPNNPNVVNGVNLMSGNWNNLLRSFDYYMKTGHF